MAKSEKNTLNKLKKRRFYKRKRFWLSLMLLGALTAGIGFIAAERYTRPYRERAETYDLERINDLEIPSIIYDRNNVEIGRIFVQNRSVIPIDDVPQIFIDALRAGEDQRFWKHDGVDYFGIVRAFYLNWKAGRQTQGASTITQQLARNAFNLIDEGKKRNETDMERKLVEAFLARRIERHYSKRQILEFYLNRVFFGSGYYGIRSASLGYFGKEPKDLDALESAAIVGAIKLPSYLSPLVDPAGNKTSRNLVLGRMAELEVLTRADAVRFSTTPLKLNPKPLQRGTSHLHERITDEIRRVMGDDALAEGGFTIHTSIDASIQKTLEQALEERLKAAEARPGYANQKRSGYRRSTDIPPEYLQGAALMVDHENGEVIAHVGGRSYADAPFDVIELGRRPLGTAFHPFLYAAGLQRDLTPATMVLDEEIDNRFVMIGGLEGIPGEWGMEVARPSVKKADITARQALEYSKIAASVRFAGLAGLQNVVDTAEAFGLPMKDAELLPRIAVGWEAASLKEAVRAISAFARGGETAPLSLSYVDRIQNAEGRTEYRRLPSGARRLSPIDSATAFLVHDMMRGGMEHGSAAGLMERMAEKPFTGAGKTGTTHDFSDNWFLGYNGRISCGVWLGFLQPGKSIYPGAFSRDLAMPVWEAGMNAAAGSFGGRVVAQPDSVETVSICRVSGQRATPYCYEPVTDPATGRARSRPAAYDEYFRKGSTPPPFCQVHSGAESGPALTGSMGLNQLAVIDTTPVRSKAPVLMGDDPYHTELTLAEGGRRSPGAVRTSVLDHFDLEEEGEPLRLPWPKRLEISPE